MLCPQLHINNIHRTTSQDTMSSDNGDLTLPRKHENCENP